jgi:hypothetical protein
MARRGSSEAASLAVELAALLEAGDHGEAARRARRLLDGSAGPAASEAARTVLARVRPDRVAAVISLSGLGLLAGLALAFLRA